MALGWGQLVTVQGVNVLWVCLVMSQSPLGLHRWSLAGCWLWPRCCLCERPPWCHGKPDNHRCIRLWRDVVGHSLLGLQNLKCLQGSADSVNESSCLGMRCKRDSIPFEGYRTVHITGIVDCCLMGMWAQVTVEMPEIQVAFYVGFKLLVINSAFKTLDRPH